MTSIPELSTISESTYAALTSLSAHFQAEHPPSDHTMRGPAESLLYHEADLLDSGRNESWASLYADDAIYWVPIVDTADPGRGVSVTLDDKRRLNDRVAWLATGFVYSHQPPAVKQRCISNVEVRALDDERWWIRSGFILHVYRRGKTDTLAGTYDHVVSAFDGSRSSIHLKRVLLIHRSSYLHNLTIIL